MVGAGDADGTCRHSKIFRPRSGTSKYGPGNDRARCCGASKRLRRRRAYVSSSSLPSDMELYLFEILEPKGHLPNLVVQACHPATSRTGRKENDRLL